MPQVQVRAETEDRGTEHVGARADRQEAVRTRRQATREVRETRLPGDRPVGGEDLEPAVARTCPGTVRVDAVGYAAGSRRRDTVSNRTSWMLSGHYQGRSEAISDNSHSV